MKLYFVAGEKSGDARGAELMEALREREPDLTFAGCGGPAMAELAGGDFLNWVEEAAVIGFVDVIRKYPWFKKRFAETLAEIERMRPDTVVLIDYPGFNLRLAAALKKRRIPARVVYYISPQVWAWHRSRIPKMAQTIDLMLCIFPFEPELYEKSGLRSEFVGHPLVDSLRAEAEEVPREPDLVGLFPGSRRKEVSKIFPPLIETAREISRIRPGTRFEASAASPAMAALMEEIKTAHPDAPEIEIITGKSHDLMRRAGAGIVASGTATLEAAILQLPHVLVYIAAWITVAVGRRVVKVPHLGIVNILAGREVVREFIQQDATAGKMAPEIVRLLDDPAARSQLLANTDAAVVKLGGSGAAVRAADAILA